MNGNSCVTEGAVKWIIIYHIANICVKRKKKKIEWCLKEDGCQIEATVLLHDCTRCPCYKPCVTFSKPCLVTTVAPLKMTNDGKKEESRKHLVIESGTLCFHWLLSICMSVIHLHVQNSEYSFVFVFARWHIAPFVVLCRSLWKLTAPRGT